MQRWSFVWWNSPWGELSWAEVSSQFPGVANFVKLNSFLPFSFSSVCGGLSRQFHKTWRFPVCQTGQTAWNKTITRPVCLLLKHASSAYWFFLKPLLSWGGERGGSRWRCIEGHKKALPNLSRQDKSASFISYSWFVIMGLQVLCSV